MGAWPGKRHWTIHDEFAIEWLLMIAPPYAQLHAFLAVARTRNFSAAARELAVSRSAVSQSIAQLEKDLGVTLVARTTRSVSLTDAGKRLVESIGPADAQIRAALSDVASKPGEVVGRVRLSAAKAAFPFVLGPVLPKFRERHPRIDVECIFDDRRVDIVGDGFDAGIRMGEYLERDMVSVRLTQPFRFIVVGAPRYLDERGTPEEPQDLLEHECLTFRSDTTGSLYAWELERGRKKFRIPVRGGVVSNDGLLLMEWAELGVGLAYVFEPLVRESLREGRLRHVLPHYYAEEPGFFLYYPSRHQRSAALQVFIESIRELIGPTGARAEAKSKAPHPSKRPLSSGT
jgi:DNA-binding transcriptional LysR family regulator